MAVDPAVIKAIEAAVAADPANAPLRMHLAQLLIDAGRGAEAAEHLKLAAGSLEGQRPASSNLPPPPPPPPREPAPIAGPDQLPAPIAGPVPDSVEELMSLWENRESPAEPSADDLHVPDVSLSQVGGMAEVKRRLELSFLAPMRNPEMTTAFGKRTGGGLLLWGPPGCGKTFLARATAGELGARFYSVGLNDVLDMWIGSSERNLASIFDVARRNAPCVLFFDEIDALGMKRSNLRVSGAAMRGAVNQLLAELDGVHSRNDGVFVLGATNHPWDIDEALVRPGRFDRSVLVLPPDQPARVAILQYHLAGKPTERLDLDAIAKQTDGFSGADLALVCDAAVEPAYEDSLRTGQMRSVTQRDLITALKDVKPSMGPWFETAKNYAVFANTTGQFDELLAYIKRRK